MESFDIKVKYLNGKEKELKDPKLNQVLKIVYE